MSEIIDSIKQGASQVLSGIDQKGQLKSAIDGIRTQLGELERKHRIGQLEKGIRSLQAEIRQLTEALGLQTLSLFDTGRISHPELARLCERINELRADMDQKKVELAELKALPAARVQCPRCQAEVAGDAEFCPRCGERLHPAQAAQPAAAPAPFPLLQAPVLGGAQAAVRFRCPKCKAVLPAEVSFCSTCGVKLKWPQAQSAPKRFCAACGAEVGAQARFCPVCGRAAGQAG